jgi:hypothetical protein
MMLQRNKSISKPVAAKKTTCLCQMLHVTLLWTRIFGLSPINWTPPKKSETEIPHKCTFVVSKAWKIYSFWLLLVYSVVYYQYAIAGFRTDNYTQLLFDLNKVLYVSFGFVLTFWGLRNASQLVEALSQVAIYVQDGWMCDGSKANVRTTVWQGIVAVMLQLVLQASTYLFTNTKEALDIYRYIIHNVPFMFYYLFCIVCSILMALFRCFDTQLMGVLQGQMSDQSKQCTSPHEFKSGPYGNRAAQIDQLRRIHEKIRSSMVDFNAAMNPQILIHQFIELLVIVMHLYSIIMFFGLPLRTPELYSTFFMDCLFVVVHACALVIFFSAADRIKNRVSELNSHVFLFDKNVYSIAIEDSGIDQKFDEKRRVINGAGTVADFRAETKSGTSSVERRKVLHN